MKASPLFFVAVLGALSACENPTSAKQAPGADTIATAETPLSASMAEQLAQTEGLLDTTCTGTTTPDGGAKGTCANGCTWNAKPLGYILASCPGAGAPTCKNPADTTNNCWSPPGQKCGAVAQAGAFGCSADGSKCCLFPDYCLPCGWVNCVEASSSGSPGVPAACGAAKLPNPDPQWTEKCPAGLIAQMHCNLCDGQMICPPDAPTTTVAF